MKKTKLYTEITAFKQTRKQKKQMLAMAKLYSGGDVSNWIRYCLESYSPKMLNKKKGEKALAPSPR